MMTGEWSGSPTARRAAGEATSEERLERRFHEHEVPSRVLGLVRRITVWMPPGARRRLAAPLPVLYLNDGQNLFDPARAFGGRTWRAAETAEWLVRRSRIPPLLIVGIDHGGERRGREYLPVEDERNPAARRPLGRQYAEFIARELIPFVAERYRVGRRASDRGLGGSSYGGVSALLTSLQYPGLFGRLLLESPSLYVGRRHILRRARRADRWPSRLYLGVGTAETSRDDSNLETVQNVLRLETILREQGVTGRRMKVVIAQGATHSEDAWASRLGEALEFLYGRRGQRRG